MTNAQLKAYAKKHNLTRDEAKQRIKMEVPSNDNKRMLAERSQTRHAGSFLVFAICAEYKFGQPIQNTSICFMADDNLMAEERFFADQNNISKNQLGATIVEMFKNGYNFKPAKGSSLARYIMAFFSHTNASSLRSLSGSDGVVIKIFHDEMKNTHCIAFDWLTSFDVVEKMSIEFANGDEDTVNSCIRSINGHKP